MSRLLLDEHPLQVLPSLATAIGLEASIILQQIHYWTTDKKGQVRDGFRWVYNSYKQWAEQFPFIAPKQIGNIIRRLETEGLLISGVYGSTSSNRTKWYRVNYDTPLLADSAPNVPIEMMNPQSNVPPGDYHSPIQGTSTISTKITTETTCTDNQPVVINRTLASKESDLFISNLWHDTFGRYPTPPQLRKTRTLLETAPLDQADALLEHAFDVMAGFKDATPGSLWGLLKKWAAQDWNTDRPQPRMADMDELN